MSVPPMFSVDWASKNEDHTAVYWIGPNGQFHVFPTPIKRNWLKRQAQKAKYIWQILKS